jgi:hypothetical protein
MQAAVESAKQSLKGIPGIFVVIEDMDKHAPSDLTKDALQTDVELRLRKAGIDVDVKSYDWPFLYVQINCLHANSGQFACSIDVKVRQAVRLYRDPKIISLGATTWETSGVQIASSARAIREYVGDFVDQFLNDYFAVNTEKATLGSR